MFLFLSFSRRLWQAASGVGAHFVPRWVVLWHCGGCSFLLCFKSQGSSQPESVRSQPSLAVHAKNDEANASKAQV